MSIQVHFFAVYADLIGSKELEVPFYPKMKNSDLWVQITQKYPAVASIPPLFAISDEYVDPEEELKDGDRVMIFPPVSGGDSRYIYDSPLSVEKMLEMIRHQDAGGEAIFIGRVRRKTKGRIVRNLYYECQLTMSEKQIHQIILEMKEKWILVKAHIEHRIGRLEIGDIAVIVAVSAEHRKEALDACRYGIDEVKRRVPIWKKEVFEDGEVWVGACAEDFSDIH